MNFKANELTYDLINMDGHLCLFNNMRIDRESIPEGLHCYDVRDDDDCSGVFAQVQSFVLVNHWGTIITKDPIPMNAHHCYWPQNEEPDFGPPMTLEQFHTATKEELDRFYQDEIAYLDQLRMRANAEQELQSEECALTMRIQDAQVRVEADPQPPQNKHQNEKEHE